VDSAYVGQKTVGNYSQQHSPAGSGDTEGSVNVIKDGALDVPDAVLKHLIV